MKRRVLSSVYLGSLVLIARGASQTPVEHRGMPTPKYAVRLEKSTRIPMRDGARLSTDLYFPVGVTERMPVVLIRTPYNKNGFRPGRSSGYYSWQGGDVRVQLFAGQGYVVAVQDLRGRFESEGEYRVGANERNDGSDTIDWLVAQPWSTGKVGTYGCSYLGETQIQLAAARHPKHAAALPQGAGGVYTGTNRTFGFMDGGAFELATAIGWFPRAGMRHFARLPAGLSDSLFRETAEHYTFAPAAPPIDYQQVFSWLPVRDIMRRLTTFPTHFEDFVSHGPADPYWRAFGFITDADQFDIPALHVNSWYDLGVNETFKLANLLSANARSARGRDNQFVIISPSAHCESEAATERTVIGRRDVGDARFDYYGTYLEWFDHWLKGADNGVTSMPKVQYYLMGRNVWRQAPAWPIPGTNFARYYLRSDGRANSRMGSGVLDPAPPAAEPSDRYTYDPANPVPSVGGVICCTTAPNTPGGSYDQSEVEMRHDVLVYTSPPLERGLEVTGPLQLVLYVSSDAKDTDFTGKLVDVAPDGTAYNLQDGILRARYREGYDRPQLMEPGRIYEIRIDLHATSNWFAPGHRIRLEVSSSNFPRLDRNLNTGGRNYDESSWTIARNAVHHSARYRSYLLLPLVP